MPDSSYISKFVREQIPLLAALSEVLPVWRHLVFRPHLFFDILRSSPNLSVKNSITFCFSSAVLLITILVSWDKIAKLIAKYIFNISNYEELDFLIIAAIAITAFAYLLVVALGSAVLNYVPARFWSKEVSFRKMLVGSIYISSFIQTISAILFLFLLGILMFSEYQVSYFGIGERRMPFGLPKLKENYLIVLWKGIAWLWFNIAAPVLSLTALASMTGLSAKRLLLTSLAMFVLIAIFVILLSFLIFKLFSKTVG